MTKIIPRFKHRTVGPRKSTGSVFLRKITPRLKRSKLSRLNDQLGKAEIEGDFTVADFIKKDN